MGFYTTSTIAAATELAVSMDISLRKREADLGYEPITYCRRCDEPLDVYQDFDHRWCGCTNPHRKYRLPVPPLEKRAFTTLENAGRCRKEAARYLAKGNSDIAGVYKRAAYEHLFNARRARVESA